jgi:hypothetical protein
MYFLYLRFKSSAGAVTENGCENLAPKRSGTPEEPAVVQAGAHARVPAHAMQDERRGEHRSRSPQTDAFATGGAQSL